MTSAALLTEVASATLTTEGRQPVEAHEPVVAVLFRDLEAGHQDSSTSAGK
jgi:hypothetical protein